MSDTGALLVALNTSRGPLAALIASSVRIGFTALAMSAMTAVAMTHAPRHRIARASGVFNASRQTPAPRTDTHNRDREPTMIALPASKLRHIYRLDADLDAPIDLGNTPHGHRRIVALTGGRAEGADLQAELLGTGGADWQILRRDGGSVADIRYTLRTDRGALLYVQSHGVRHGKPEVLARLAAGEDVDASEYTFRTTVTIETSAPELAWLNDGVFIAVGGRRPGGVSYDVYLVE